MRICNPFKDSDVLHGIFGYQVRNMMFKKMVGIEPLSLVPSAEKKLDAFAEEVVLYRDIPANADEIASRIGDADAVLLSYTSTLGREALAKCPQVQYIGMCCSLYSPESANVDIRYANERGIVVTGIRDYGDEGVVEYVISELVRCLHGFGTDPDGSPAKPWDGVPREITGLKAGIVGLGKSGGMVADALKFFGAEISYFARSEKTWAADKGYRFLPLMELLSQNEVVVTCLNKNTVLLHEEEFARLGHRKILFNTGLSPAWDETPFARWLEGDNLCFCDTVGALGGEKFVHHPHVRCMNVSSGRTRQAFERLSVKVLANLSEYNR
jgi:phosphoglycerate dehydrogenase-like enzyme